MPSQAATAGPIGGSFRNLPSFFVLLPRVPIASASLKPQSRTRPICSSGHRLRQQSATGVSKLETARDSVERLLRLKGSCPLRLLREDAGDWNSDRFWTTLGFLRRASRSREILPLFEAWKNVESSRVIASDYERIIGLLCDDDLVEDAVTVLRGMITDGMRASVRTYNSILHGFAGRGSFEEVSSLLDKMKEVDIVPDTDTYRGLIRAFGKHRMFDEMRSCVKRIGEDDLLSCDHVIYNVLMREYARGGLIHRVESIYGRLLSKRMYIQPDTLVAILEMYTELGILDKMETAYLRVLNSKAILKENVIRKMAHNYVKNLMFSRLDDLGINHPPNHIGELSWCLRLLSYACLSSQQGIDSVVDKMEEEGIPWNATFANTVLLSCLKTKDINRLKVLLKDLPVMPDIVTLGVLLDAKRIGLDMVGTFHRWRGTGFLEEVVEMKTDPLVISALGKGRFLKSVEELYCRIDPDARNKKRWTYGDLIDLVSGT